MTDKQNKIDILEMKLELIDRIGKTESSIYSHINCLKKHMTTEISKAHDQLEDANQKWFGAITNFMAKYDIKLDDKIILHTKECQKGRQEIIDRLKNNVKFAGWLISGLVAVAGVVIKLLN